MKKKRGRIIEKADCRIEFFSVKDKKTKGKSVYATNFKFEEFIQKIIDYLISEGYFIK